MDEKLASEMVAKLKEAKSAEELMAIVKEYGGEVTGEQMKTLAEQMGAQGGLADDELEGIAGGKIDWGYVDEQIRKYGPGVVPALCAYYDI